MSCLISCIRFVRSNVRFTTSCVIEQAVKIVPVVLWSSDAMFYSQAGSKKSTDRED